MARRSSKNMSTSVPSSTTSDANNTAAPGTGMARDVMTNNPATTSKDTPTIDRQATTPTITSTTSPSVDTATDASGTTTSQTAADRKAEKKRQKKARYEANKKKREKAGTELPGVSKAPSTTSSGSMSPIAGAQTACTHPPMVATCLPPVDRNVSTLSAKGPVTAHSLVPPESAPALGQKPARSRKPPVKDGTGSVLQGRSVRDRRPIAKGHKELTKKARDHNSSNPAADMAKHSKHPTMKLLRMRRQPGTDQTVNQNHGHDTSSVAGTVCDEGAVALYGTEDSISLETPSYAPSMEEPHDRIFEADTNATYYDDNVNMVGSNNGFTDAPSDDMPDLEDLSLDESRTSREELDRHTKEQEENGEQEPSTSNGGATQIEAERQAEPERLAYQDTTYEPDCPRSPESYVDLQLPEYTQQKRLNTTGQQEQGRMPANSVAVEEQANTPATPVDLEQALVALHVAPLRDLPVPKKQQQKFSKNRGGKKQDHPPVKDVTIEEVIATPATPSGLLSLPNAAQYTAVLSADAVQGLIALHVGPLPDPPAPDKKQKSRKAAKHLTPANEKSDVTQAEAAQDTVSDEASGQTDTRQSLDAQGSNHQVADGHLSSKDRVQFLEVIETLYTPHDQWHELQRASFGTLMAAAPVTSTTADENFQGDVPKTKDPFHFPESISTFHIAHDNWHASQQTVFHTLMSSSRLTTSSDEIPSAEALISSETELNAAPMTPERLTTAFEQHSAAKSGSTTGVQTGHSGANDSAADTDTSEDRSEPALSTTGSTTSQASSPLAKKKRHRNPTGELREMRNTFLGGISLDTFLIELPWDQQTGTTTKQEICEVFAGLSDSDSRLAQRRIKLGNTSLYDFLRGIAFDADEAADVRNVAKAFRTSAKESLRASSKIARFLELESSAESD
ncbi:hypothetical protein BU26DRAFT_183763 [Trematosphaeria pertusa]|uniref:Uncharacterized protein n=1 Tax=Trematosphaeria pertusa TaxID=390896 RepID=A0A6A6HT16_9PLEO|nr:uncharacterized protein BU26DRAFT_183763 [Trematosphaeria pertusa]KAF2241246.1 hypothetical protein BU26DRAFT_183763 [Trematosphaeria pertusa]